VEEICSCDGVIGLVQFCKSHLRIGIDECLLINPAYAFQGPHEERILGSKIAWVMGFDFPSCHGLLFLFFHRCDLGFSENKAFIGNFLL